jgi:3-deoxy-D-manno-octulosonic-acid transferase
MIYFYHLLSLFVAILLLPLFSLIALSSKHKWKGLAHHFGWVPAIKKSDRKTLWLHALSMGEVVAATPVLKLVREQNPKLTIALSVTTDSGYAAALKMNVADNVFFHPLDCLPFTLLALKRINPDLHVVTDTGFWPGLIDLLYRKNIPILLFNGRISERSARRYLIAGSLFKDTFQKFHQLGMQNSNGEKAVLTLGVDQNCIEVMGDPKYDAQQPLTGEEKEQLRKTFKLEEDTPVWIAGSTHAGEEEIILNAHQQLTAEHPNLVLILAPRRIERVKEVVTLLKKKNISFTLRSLMEHAETVILLDTMGELAQIYSLGQVAIIGKSLVKPGGGHSLIEPLSYGLPVMHGPFIENIGHVADKARGLGLAIPVHNSKDIKEKVHSLLENKSLRQKLAEKALSFTKEQQGASEKMAETITKILTI